MPQGQGFFISPDGELLSVATTHIAMLITDPHRFGTTRRWVEGAYRRHREPLFHEGLARDEVLAHVLAKGWIRIRERIDRNRHWSFQFGRWSPSVARRARAWAGRVLRNSPSRRHDTVDMAGVIDKFERAARLSVLAGRSKGRRGTRRRKARG